MAEIVNGLKYSKEHEWVKIENGRAKTGITDYAQDALGDIVFIELPEIGHVFTAGDVMCTIESVKAASDVYAPVSGKVVEVNDEILEVPENLNSVPYDSWLVELEISDMATADALMSDDDYETFCNSL